MKRSVDYDDSPETPIVSNRWTTLEIAQTPEGIQYPKRIREVLRFKTMRSGQLEVIDSIREKHVVVVDTSAVPDEALFMEEQASIRQ